MKTAYLGLGSNLGDRMGFLRAGVRHLRSSSGVVVRKVSSVYETKPIGVLAQPDFLNVVVEIGTTVSPRELLTITQRIENTLGRERDKRWGPRTIDVDVLWFEGTQSDDADLTLPHPRAKERSFVLTPWAEIAPELELEGESITSRAKKLTDDGVARLGDWERFGEAT